MDSHRNSPFLKTTWQGGTLSLEGEFDLSTAPAVVAQIGTEREQVELDLRGVTFIDSIGLGTLVDLNEILPVLTIIVDHSGPVLKVVKLMGLDKTLDIRMNGSPADSAIDD